MPSNEIEMSTPDRETGIFRDKVTDDGREYSVLVYYIKGKGALSIVGMSLVLEIPGERQPEVRLEPLLSSTILQVKDGPSIQCRGIAAVFYQKNLGFRVIPIDDRITVDTDPVEPALKDYIVKFVRAYGFGHSWEIVDFKEPKQKR